MKYNIAYCIEGFYNHGGMERILSVCANLLSDIYSITIIVANQRGREHAYNLAQNINVVDLCVSSTNYKEEYKKSLTRYLQDHRFSVVISLAGLELFFLPQIKDGSKKVMWFHFAFDVSKMFLSERFHGWKLNLLYYIHTIRRIYFAKKFDTIVVLSKSDCDSWSRFCNNVKYIYNPITIDRKVISNLSEESVIAVGRLGWQKGFDFLIDSWVLVDDKHPDWHLDIFGEGPDRLELQHQIDRKGLHDKVRLCGVTKQIEEEYGKHSIYVMSSRAEGFPLALLEASSCGLPMISFNCHQGPSEIIQEGENGFLVDKVGDIYTLSNRICKLIEDNNLRNMMGEKALVSSFRFEGEVIKKDWINLLKQLI